MSRLTPFSPSDSFFHLTQDFSNFVRRYGALIATDRDPLRGRDEALGALQRSDAKKWWPIIKELGIKAE
jgi:hypothetical protein